MKLMLAIAALAVSMSSAGAVLPDENGALHLWSDAGQRVGHDGAHSGRGALEKLGQPVIVENRLGAGGLVGAKWVATQEPDGHNVMMYASAFTVSTLLNPGLDPKELVPVATVATIPTIMITPPGRYKTAKDFVAAAKAQPGKLNCATAGSGSATHMALERFRAAAGFEVQNIHTKGAGEALTEVISGRADCYFALVFQAQKMKDAGKVDAHLVSGPKRTSLMPDLPTTEEAGYPNSAYNFWVGTLVAAKTPRPIVERLHNEINALVQSPDISDRIKSSAPIRCRSRFPSSRR